MSMAVSLEVRSPFLDHRLAEFSAALPPSMKVHNSVRKYILKKMVLKKRLLPKEIISRKKQGFGVPIDYWYHRGFDDLAAQVFERTYSEGNFESILARTQVSEILKKPFANAAKIFALMVLAVWYQMYIIRDERVPPLEIEKYT